LEAAETTMTEDPEIIRLNIRQYHELLKLHFTAETRVQVMELLAEAQAQLHSGEAQAQARVRKP
jgi:hypothetical protein